MAGIEAVVFDIGNVLLRWDPHGFYDRVIGAERRRALWGAVDLEAMNLRSDAGEDIADLVAETAAAHPAHAGDIRRWHDDWLQMAGPVIEETAGMLRALRARGMPCFALSNFGVRTLAMADAAYPELADFDRRFISGALRMMKPDPAIYAHVETETGIAPQHLFFTDDSPANIAAARARGWQVHLFEGPRGLSERLRAEGLL